MSPRRPRPKDDQLTGSETVIPSPELARQNFHKLLLSNPNYFGNLPGSSLAPVLKIQADTTYESICAVGYNPLLDQLKATICVMREDGYAGGLGTGGSFEYVRFYLSYDGGTTWQNQGMKAVNVFDVPGPKPLEYSISLQVSPKEKFRFLQKLPLVRVILSWNAPPPVEKPNWVPVWGNVMDSEIKLDGLDLILLSIARAEAKVQPKDEIPPTGIPFDAKNSYRPGYTALRANVESCEVRNQGQGSAGLSLYSGG